MSVGSLAAMGLTLAGASLERVTDGYFALPQGPGLGLQVNPSLLGKEVA